LQIELGLEDLKNDWLFSSILLTYHGSVQITNNVALADREARVDREGKDED
jgi:hypothetical protein